MPSNDKISLMTAAVGGDLVGSTSRIEVSSLYTTVPVTLGATLALLRTTMLAGGSGYTATDPIVCGAITSSGALNLGANTVTAGAASFTTGVFSSTVAVSPSAANAQLDLTRASNSYAAVLRFMNGVTREWSIYVDNTATPDLLINGTGGTALTFAAATKNATFGGALAVTGTSTLTGNVGIGTTSNAGRLVQMASSTLTSTQQIAAYISLTGSSAATSFIKGIEVATTTAAAVYTCTSLYGISIEAHALGAGSAVTSAYGISVANQGAAGITNAYGVYIVAQSGAATTNIGLYNAGTTTLVGAVTMSGALTMTATAVGTLVIGGVTNDYGATYAVGLANANGWLFSKQSAANNANRVFSIVRADASGGVLTNYGSDFVTPAWTVTGGAVVQTGSLTVGTAFGCNTKAAQTAYASGGALAVYGAGANGFDSGANASALHAMVVSLRAALVANGIMS